MRSQIRYASVLLGPVFMAAVLVQAAPIYKHIDQEGNVTYSEVPPPGQGEVETVTVQPELPPGQVEAAQERMQRLEELSSELQESRKDREDARAKSERQQPAPSPPQSADYDDGDSDRYPYYYPGYAWPRPPGYRPRPPGYRPRPPGVRPPGLQPRPPGLPPRPPSQRPGIEQPIAPTPR